MRRSVLQRRIFDPAIESEPPSLRLTRSIFLTLRWRPCYSYPMTRRRWIADEFSADRAALTGAHAAHLSRTLRARVGQEFEVACGERVRRATVASVSDDRVEFTLGEEVTASAVVPITLLLAIFKFDRMEWAIEKCTELNVTTIIPVIARRTEKHLALAAAKRVERWRRIAREAAEQSRRACASGNRRSGEAGGRSCEQRA